SSAFCEMASSPLHPVHHMTAPQPHRDTVDDFLCGCGVAGCYGCVAGAHADYKHTTVGNDQGWFLSGGGSEGVGEGGGATADATAQHNTASFYSTAASDSSTSPVDQSNANATVQTYSTHLQYAQPTSLPQIDSLMTSEAETMFFDRMNDMKFGDVKMEPGILGHPPAIDLFQHPELNIYHGMTSYNGYTLQDYSNQLHPHLIFDPTPPSAAPLLPAHLSYEQPYAPSPSCTTSNSVGSAFSSLQPSSLHQQQPATSSSYSPPPQDPLVASSIHSRTAQKKRIQAVSCHSNSICANCGTRDTSLWRRNTTGEIECNACNLYFRKNGRKRPMSLKKGVIMKRNRKPRTNSESN
ncbi:hypothetical protein PENTCL1PPCAC_25133, partial [Pristionchus entomophagus]